MATTSLTQREVTSASFMDDFLADCRSASPMMAVLCEAVGVRW